MLVAPIFKRFFFLQWNALKIPNISKIWATAHGWINMDSSLSFIPHSDSFNYNLQLFVKKIHGSREQMLNEARAS
jgi:hypothetical protein